MLIKIVIHTPLFFNISEQFQSAIRKKIWKSCWGCMKIHNFDELFHKITTYMFGRTLMESMD